MRVESIGRKSVLFINLQTGRLSEMNFEAMKFAEFRLMSAEEVAALDPLKYLWL